MPQLIPKQPVWRWLLSLSFLIPGAFVLGLNVWFTFPATSPDASVPPDVVYFAYGSNMNDRYLTRVRGVTRHSSEAAKLSGFEVRFNLEGMTFLEPAFANLSPKPGHVAYGVVHRLPTDQFNKIIGSEGPGYGLRDVQVVLADGSTLIAKTLISKPTLSQEASPSRRYLSFLHEAATDYAFPEAHVHRYNPDNGAYMPVVSELFGAAIQTVVWITARL